MRTVWRRTVGGLIPVCETGAKIWPRIKIGQDVILKIERPRNPQHHRKLWKLITIVWENTEGYATPELFLAKIKCETGHADMVQLDSGAHAFIPRSIAFENMSQDEFEAFYDRAIDYIIEHIWPEMQNETLKLEVERFLA